jgi:NADH-quinone oxidoreductase subunit L
MEGPTPVSALIHAATMVTAGVYLIARTHPLFEYAPHVADLAAGLGAATLLMAGLIALVQNDIKRVIAYSTMSQIGYMFVGVSVGAYPNGMFHLMTHAFFKALLFLAAGSVIHGLSGEQDMRKMGGLRTEMPWTFWTMTMATLAISGAPLFSGFFSKDLILFKTYASPYGSHILWAVLLLTAFMTSFYMFRLWFLTFFGEYRGAAEQHGHEKKGQEKHDHHGHAHESPMVMVLPLAFLAILSVAGGWIGTPWHNSFGNYLAPVFSEYSHDLRAASVSGEISESGIEPAATESSAPKQSEPSETLFSIAASAAGVFGFLLALYLYYLRPDLPPRYAASMRGLYNTLSNKYYVDEFYGAAIIRPIIAFSSAFLWKTIDAGIIDGTINESAAAAADVSNAFRRMQSGNIRSYAAWVALGAAAVIAFMVWTGGLR